MEKNLLSIFLLPLLLAACSNDTNPITKEDVGVYNSLLGITIKKPQDVLEFKDETAFKQAVQRLTEAQTSRKEIGQLTVLNNTNISFIENGFHSIYDDYVNAMNEAESYCDTEEGYYEFKAKYSNLYFPEEGDDISAYLPVSDKDVAKLLNSKGDVIIGDKLVNMIDINSYEQLQNLGLTFESSTNKLRSAINELDEVQINNRRLKARVYERRGSNQVYWEVIVDVSFRKKGALGLWYNYSSHTELGWYNPSNGAKSYIGDKNGLSSHDYEIIRQYSNGQPVPMIGVMYIDFQGFGSEGTLQFINVNI